MIAASWFGDLTPRESHALMVHAETCAGCREAMELGAQTLNSIGKPLSPELPDHFWEGYWLRLTQKMDKGTNPERGVWRLRRLEFLHAQWPLGFRLATAAVIFVAGVLISRMWWMPEPAIQVTETSLPAPRPVQIDTRADDLLSRSKVLLIGLTSIDPEAINEKEFSFAPQRRASKELLVEAAALRNAPGAKADRQLLQLMGQLEIVLLQIANLETEHDISAVELVRTSIDREGLLLKINIEEMKRQMISANTDKSL